MPLKLAIEGGKPIREDFLSYGRQWIDRKDIQAVVEILSSDWLTQGPKVREFEEKFAKYCGAKFAVAVNNGTNALFAACFAAGIGKGDEVVTSPLTFVASANCILYCGGIPKFVDIDAKTYNLDTEKLEEYLEFKVKSEKLKVKSSGLRVGSEEFKIKNSKLRIQNSKIKAMIPVHFAGQPAELDEIYRVAKKYRLIVIEDASHALGAKYKGKKIGSFGDLACFSFHPVKHITTGEGGMITTNNKKFYERLLLFRTHGITHDKKIMTKCDGPWYYEMQELGHNCRITDFQCALGISQLQRVDEFISRRSEIANYYNQAFKEMEEIRTPRVRLGSVCHVWHLYVIQLKLERLKVGRRKIFEALRAENLGVNVHYIPVHLQPYYQKRFGYKLGDYPVAERVYERIITLPLYPKMTKKDARDVVRAVKKVVGYYRR